MATNKGLPIKPAPTHTRSNEYRNTAMMKTDKITTTTIAIKPILIWALLAIPALLGAQNVTWVGGNGATNVDKGETVTYQVSLNGTSLSEWSWTKYTELGQVVGTPTSTSITIKWNNVGSSGVWYNYETVGGGGQEFTIRRSVTVNEVVVPMPTLSTVTHPVCPETDGTFTITNYDPQYTYTAIPSTGVFISGNTVTAPAGSYVIRASLGSSVSDNSVNRSVNQPTTSAVPELELVSQPDCSDETQGTFRITNYDPDVTYIFEDPVVQRVEGLVTALPGTYRVASLPTGAPSAQCTSDWSNSITIDSPPLALGAGTIDTTTQNICYNTDAGNIIGTPATGEDGNYTYTWMHAPSQNGDYEAISNSNSESYNPFTDLLVDRWYKRKVEACGKTAFTDPVKIDVSPSLSNGGEISAPPGVCQGGNPGAITSVSAATGGGSDLEYEWSWSPNQNGNYNDIPNSNSETYNPPVINASRWYQRTATSCGQTVSSNKVLVAVVPTLSEPTGTTSLSVCGNATTVLSLTADPNADGVRWYNADTGGSPIGDGDITRGPGTYYASSYHSYGCESTRTMVMVVSTTVLQWYPDSDNDGYRDPGSTSVNDCSDRGDFWTQDPEEDLCPNVFSTDNAPPTRWYVDEDNDGLRDSDTDAGETDCSPRSTGWTSDPAIDNCPGLNDPTNPQPQIWYADLENGGQGDGLGDPDMPSEPLCIAPAGYVANSDDQCPDILSPTNDCTPIRVNCTTSGNSPVAIGFTGDNYVYSRTYQQEVDAIPGSKFANDDAYIQDITYYDGLGRPMQRNAVRQSPSEKDIITHMEYDAYGRMIKEWLPFHDGSNNPIGRFRTGNMAQTTQDYYGLYYREDFGAQINPFAEKRYEGSPLNRIEKQAAPGSDWAMGSGHEIEFAYATNSVADGVRRFDVDLDPATFVPSLAPRPDYAPGELYKNVTRDENHDGTGKDHTIEEYTDKQGRVLLKRTFNNGEAHDTYYVYDDHGNLTYVMPPKMNGDPTHMDELGYRYVYDHRNRLVEKRIPGKGKEYIVYNKLDQPIMTQDANQRLNNEWLFTKYDAFGRVAYTGKAADGRSRGALQTDADATTRPWVDQKATDQQGSFTGIPDAIYYDNQGYPSGTITEILTINYYDSYVHRPSGVPGSVTLLDDPNNRVNSTRVEGLPTVSRVKVLDQTPSKWITTVTYYDEKGRPIYTHSTNEFLETDDIVETHLDFVGKPLKTRSTHTRLLSGAEATIVTIDNFTYDHSGRLLAQTQCIGDGTLGTACPGGTVTDTSTELPLSGPINTPQVHHARIVVTSATLDPGANLYIDPTSNGSGSQELIVYNTYDNLGQLASKKVGGKASVTNGTVGAVGLQTVSYDYNVRGWLTAINDVNGTSKLFNFSVHYNDPVNGAAPLYNGNISETVWRTANNDSSLKYYSYGYDALNRITGADDNTGKFNVSGITYDKNGNIATLKREGWTSASPSLAGDTGFGNMDDLVYTYLPNSNKLAKVTDGATIDQFGFKDDAVNTAADTDDDYGYDANGNMVSDANKGITDIDYNHLNLPTKVTVNGANNGTLDNVYDATGTKLRKINTEGGVTITTDYAGNFVYEGNTLKQFYQPEGYVEPDGNGWQYVYQYADIWGNTRLTYADDDNSGTIDPSSEILREQNYYPFGLEHMGYNNVSYGAKNNLKTYQSQEFTEDLGLDVHEWRYRISDPATGRFWQIDPLAENYMYNSTYAFQENKLGMGVELEGLENLNWDELSEEGIMAGTGTGIDDGTAQKNSYGASTDSGTIDSFFSAIGDVISAGHDALSGYITDGIVSIVGTASSDNTLSDSEFADAVGSGNENDVFTGLEQEAAGALNALPEIAGETGAMTLEGIAMEIIGAALMAKPNPKSVHGNSKASTKTQHGYRIEDVNTGETLEFGISGQKVNKNGTSPRVRQKIRTKYGNNPNVRGEVVKDNIPNRRKALKWEQNQVNRFFKKNGRAPVNQIRPTPKG